MPSITCCYLEKNDNLEKNVKSYDGCSLETGTCLSVGLLIVCLILFGFSGLSFFSYEELRKCCSISVINVVIILIGLSFILFGYCTISACAIVIYYTRENFATSEHIRDKNLSFSEHCHFYFLGFTIIPHFIIFLFKNYSPCVCRPCKIFCGTTTSGEPAEVKVYKENV